ncbi:MAG: glutamate 5-kinase [Neisseriaceae bacterium]
MPEVAKILVVKVGSSLVTNNGVGIDEEQVRAWAAQVAQLKEAGYKVVLVSSGSIAAGLQHLNWHSHSKKVSMLQAAAAVGQMCLSQIYQRIFEEFSILTAQILLTHDEIKNRERYLNARATLLTLLEHQVVPIVNENDTVSTREIKLGNNDILGALVTNLVAAKLYVILTDQLGLYDSDPRKNPLAQLLDEVSVEDSRLLQFAGGAGSPVGTGGMLTKIQAAQKAASSGASTIIASGKLPNVLIRIAQGETIGTKLQPESPILNARQQWMMSQLIPSGVVIVDVGASLALRKRENSLLPVGCIAVSGTFRRGDVVCIQTQQREDIARGLVNYSSEEALRILGCSTHEIEERLGYMLEEELVHRNHMVFLERAT